jgi:hypothetical protein
MFFFFFFYKMIPIFFGPQALSHLGSGENDLLTQKVPKGTKVKVRVKKNQELEL